jgi:hypothetical protein
MLLTDTSEDNTAAEENVSIEENPKLILSELAQQVRVSVLLSIEILFADRIDDT